MTSSGCAAEAATARFAEAMAEAGGWEAHPLLAVALSGGPDSLCLALLAVGWAKARGGSVLALVLDHGLRPAARTEAALAAAWAEAAGLAVRRLALAPGVAPTAAALRRARHAALAEAAAEAGALHLLLGQHAADQAETVVLRALRGSGPRGLGAMAQVRHGERVRLLRPLLGIAPGVLRQVLRRSGQPWCLDPSNDSLGTRAAIRQALADRDGEGAGVRALLAVSEAHRRAATELDRQAAALLARSARLGAAGSVVLDAGALAAAEPGLVAHAVAAVLARVSGRPYPIAPGRRESLPRLLAAGRPFTLGGCLLRPGRGTWQVTRERRMVAQVAEPVPVGYAVTERDAPAA